MAALLGREVLTKDYETVRIRIAFHPQDERFEVANPLFAKTWPGSTMLPTSSHPTQPDRAYVRYSEKNPGVDRKMVSRVLKSLRKIINNHVGVIELADDLDIETVTEIFIRVNSAGCRTLASGLRHVKDRGQRDLRRQPSAQGDRLFLPPRCCAGVPSQHREGRQGLRCFRVPAADALAQGCQRRHLRPDLYRHAARGVHLGVPAGKLQDLVALLSGRNFETKQYEEAIAEESFGRLKQGILSFINKTHFDRITMILRSAGFVTSDLIGGRNAINFAYILYLRGRAESMPAADLERLVRRWYAMSILRGRYTGSPETAFDFDIRQIEARGLASYTEAVIETELPESFWTGMLPQLMDTSSAQSPYFLAYQAAQVKLGDKGFLSRDITVLDLLMNRSDVHHVYPRNYLKSQGLARGRYNQIANFVLAQSEINIAIGDKAPESTSASWPSSAMAARRSTAASRVVSTWRPIFEMHCLPECLLNGKIPSFDDFLEGRRKLMAHKIKQWFEVL